MADVKISELSDVTSLSGSDTLPVVQSGTTKEATVEQVRSFKTNVSKTAAYTATLTDHFIDCDATSAAFSITLPAVASSSGKELIIKKIDSSANAVTVDGNASETIDGATTYSLAQQYDSVTIYCDGSEWHIIGEVVRT